MQMERQCCWCTITSLVFSFSLPCRLQAGVAPILLGSGIPLCVFFGSCFSVCCMIKFLRLVLFSLKTSFLSTFPMLGAVIHSFDSSMTTLIPLVVGQAIFVGGVYYHPVPPPSFEELRGGIVSDVAIGLSFTLVQFFLSRAIHRTKRRFRDEVEKMNEQKSRFIRCQAHDLRSPLACITGMLSLALAEGSSEKRRRQYLEAALSSAAELSSNIGGVLEMGALETKGSIEPLIENFDLSSLVSGISNVYWMRSDKVGLVCSARGLNCDASADRRLIMRCLANLINNALRHSENSKTSVMVELTVEGRELTAIVEDKGDGMCPETLKKAFLWDASTVQSSGLGLPFSRSLVRSMGGTISLESEGVGLGSRATVRVPLKDVKYREGKRVLEGVGVKVITQDEHLENSLRVWGEVLGFKQTDNGQVVIYDTLRSKDEDSALDALMKAEVPLVILAYDVFADFERRKFWNSKRHRVCRRLFTEQELVNSVMSVLGETGARSKRDAKEEESSETTLEKNPASGLLCLIIEDNTVMAMVLRTRLTKDLGLRCEVARTIQQAKEALTEKAFDVVVSDWNVGEKETAEALVEIASKDGTFVAVVSADASSSVQEASRRAGAKIFLPKPVDFHLMKRLLAEKM